MSYAWYATILYSKLKQLTRCAYGPRPKVLSLFRRAVLVQRNLQNQYNANGFLPRMGSDE